MTTAFVLSGGGSLGAVQVGMLEALTARGIRPDLLVGASAGAINAVFVAGHGTEPEALAGLERIWQGLRRRDIFPVSPQRSMLALAGARPSLCTSDGLRRVVTSNINFTNLESATIPISIVATEVISGLEVVLDHGDAVDAVMASAAIPAVYPPVTIDGQVLFDGGVANNTPISHAVALGADRVVVLPAGVACALPHAPRSMIGIAMHALTLLIEQRLVLDVERYQNDVELMVMPPLCPLSVASTDFAHARQLIHRARATTSDWLDAGRHRIPHPEQFLGLHRHRHHTPAP